MIFVKDSDGDINRDSWAQILQQKACELENYRKVNTPIAMNTLKLAVTFR